MAGFDKRACRDSALSSMLPPNAEPKVAKESDEPKTLRELAVAHAQEVGHDIEIPMNGGFFIACHVEGTKGNSRRNRRDSR